MLPLSLRSHVLAFDRLRRAVALVLGDRSVLEEVTGLAFLSCLSLA